MKILLFTPWFGALPNYFNTWKKSIQHLKNNVDVVFITDSIFEDGEEENLIVKHVAFTELQQKFLTVFEGKQLPHPYKLCDYKPVYNMLFSEFVTDQYDYWGYCDIDTVLGDVVNILQKIEYFKYDRVGEKGHFTIYRNDKSLVNIHKTVIPGDINPYHKFSYLSKTTYPCHFDEDGMNRICDFLGLKCYLKSLVFNTVEKNFHIHTDLHNSSDCELLTWEKGHTYRYHLLANGEIVKEEQMYIHYQYQKDMPQIDELGDSFFISFDGFRHFDSTKLRFYLTEYGRPDNQNEQSAIAQHYCNALRKNRWLRIQREFRYMGFWQSICNIVVRAKFIFVVIFKYHNY